ncbi:insulinase family protein [Candidatus Kuenenbacteria bacterium]|nr:insulinase family protein [Candidatus Kuenenbacteria bacterium]
MASIILIGAGSRYENKNNNGISHFLEHMFFKGTKKRPTQKQISETIEKVGGQVNAFTSIDHMGFWTKVPKKHFKLGIEFLSDLVLNSLIKPKEIKKEKGVILEEINMYLDNPQSLVSFLIHQLMWKNQALGFDPLGEKEIIKKITQKDFLKYIQNLCQPSNMVISVAGDIKHKQIVEEVEKLFTPLDSKHPTGFNKIKNNSTKKFIKAKDQQNKPQILLRKKDTDQAHLCLSLKSNELFYNNRKKTIYQILNTILGGTASSRLFTEIREKKGLAYYIYSSLNYFDETGALVVSAGLNINKIDQAIKIILKEFNKLKNIKISKVELNKIKEYLKGNLLLETDNTDFICNWYGLKELFSSQKIQTPEEKIVEIEKITINDVQKAAKKIFKTNKLNLAIIGNLSENEKNLLPLLKI